MSQKQVLTAVDIGTSKVATVVATYDAALQSYHIAGFASVPSKGVKKGVVVDIDQVTECVEASLQKTERMAGCAATQVVMGIGGPHVASLNSHGVVAIANPRGDITQNDVTRAIEGAKAVSLPSNRQVLFVSPKQFTVDGQPEIHNPVGMSGVRLEVDCHIITASTTNLRNLDRVIEIIDVQNDGFIFSGMASAEAVVTEAEKDLGVAVVDIGAGKMDLCVYIEGSLTYSASLPIGARHITNDIAIGLRLPLETAEELKIFMSRNYQMTGTGSKSIELPDISTYLARGEAADYTAKTVYQSIITARIEEMIQMIHTELDKNGFNKLLPAGVVLTGGGASTIGMVETVKGVLRMPVRLGKTQLVTTGMGSDMMGPEYATVLGLMTYAYRFQSGQASAASLLGGLGTLGRTLGTGMKGNSGSWFRKIKSAFQQFLP